ncbi:hypothetical protein P280DRAFT_471637 [Massarina eburnea CBS 473.64]|uniref:Uncharacterized protein n=1 Tax=Massarina eburnea CBS 473.64 TaxID=1395130 RepID=A0A6A6RTG5_9PLEO|nr:hypothetical protein P280DRAFT_471637 [Massarina eburnea CBS 473.64]
MPPHFKSCPTFPIPLPTPTEIMSITSAHVHAPVYKREDRSEQRDCTLPEGG